MVKRGRNTMRFSESDSDNESVGVGENQVPRQMRRNPSLKRPNFVDLVLSGKDEFCLENFRMDKLLFCKLCDILQTKGLLHHTSRLRIEDQVAIFLFIIGHNLRNRAVQEQFQYSGETISRHFNNVLNAIAEISSEFFDPPNDAPPYISQDPRYFPYFEDCVGVVDSTHIPVMVGVDEQGPFRNEKGLLSQNVLAACSFDMKFHYVLAGWEGSAPDMQVLHSALTRSYSLQIPEGKYYLVDNKFANVPGFIAPYESVPYSENDYPIGYSPQRATELFNLRHSSLRRTSDRTFAALKSRFPVLMTAPPYPLSTQVKLVVVTCVLHNFIRTERPDDWLFSMYDRDDIGIQTEEPMPPVGDGQRLAVDLGFQGPEMDFMRQYRDYITSTMWRDYMYGFKPY